MNECHSWLRVHFDPAPSIGQFSRSSFSYWRRCCRTILQMSVWQEWLISLAYIYPENDTEAQISELAFQVLDAQ